MAVRFTAKASRPPGSCHRRRGLRRAWAQGKPPDCGILSAVGAAGFAILISAAVAAAQTAGFNAAAQAAPQAVRPPHTSGAPLTITLADAIERAQRNSPQFQAALRAVKSAQEDRVQARAALMPSLGESTQYLNTQGNGISPVGRFVTNDGVHVYREWAVVHQDLSPTTYLGLAVRRAAAAAAFTRANSQIALRGLRLTVTQNYYALIVSQRQYAAAQQAQEQAAHFLQIGQELEKGGEVAHSDVIRLQLQYNQARQGLQEANLNMENARLNLAVLLFADLNENFNAVDDLDLSPALPGFAEAEKMARTNNPEVGAALAALRVSKADYALAKSAFYPSLSVDLDYGIEANAFALNSVNNTYQDRVQPNLGYFVTYAMNIPVWDWGMRLSKLRQARMNRSQAQLELHFMQKRTLSRLYSLYNEAQAAWTELDTLRSSADLAATNLRLITLRYRSGDATVLDVVDAQSSVIQARNAYASGQARYRVALANLQTLTGSF
jgi:outer membrane protein TolC